jgi:hypothetical protein
MMRGIAIALLSVSAASACSSSASDEPPSLEVLTPERGTLSDSSTVRVTGIANASKVVVNGTEAIVQKDGTFEATLNVEDGITLIETHAIRGDVDIRDVRAVMAGTLSPTDGSISGPIAARVGVEGFNKVGGALASTAQALDWQTLATSMNPIYDSSGCNSAVINIEELSVGTIGIGLTPHSGAVAAGVTIDDVYVKMKVNFRAVCIGGSTHAVVRASRANINGDLALNAKGGKLDASLPASSVALDGFSLDISGVPGAIESLVKGKVREAAEKALNNVIKDQVPPKANEALGGLLAQSLNANLLDHNAAFTITPSSVVIDDTGMIAAVDTKVLVTGGEGGMFVSSPMPLDSMAWGEGDVGLALADDVVNQLFSGLWATGAITPTVKLEGPLAVLSAILDGNTKSINGVIELAVGDLILSARDESDTELQSFALSLTTTLTAAPNTAGSIGVQLGEPTIRAQVIKQSPNEDTTGEQLEGLVDGAWGLVGNMLGDTLAGVPMPSVAGMQVGAPALKGQQGFLLVDVPLQ